ncbi:hypothetical protein PIB30_069906 [Stylosanthes scabra]|uniref:Uncharacterized protein n=1 Tax=Stylosanthes scabra TaxID=79078 RepID=A0ABU6WR55_9FABA|nr:hypothetical protein [Stylosanthes scabra]
MRTTIDYAWMFDGVTKDRVYALSLASRLRVYMRWKPYGWIGPEGRGDERNDDEMVEWYPSRFTEPSWNGFENFVTIESIRLWGNRFVFAQRPKLPNSNQFVGIESTPHSKFHEPPSIESIRWVTEPIRFHPVFKFNVQNALRIDSSSSESILKRRNMVSRGAGRAIDSAYGNSGPSGVVSACGVLVFTWDKS